MITEIRGSIFDSRAEAIVNPVNTKGVMGKGLALEFKRRFPVQCNAYRAACSHGAVKIGKVLVCSVHVPSRKETVIAGTRYVVHFPTKDHWLQPSEMAYIKEGLWSLVAEVTERRIQSVAIPALGCGLGGLRWDDVRPLIAEAMGMVVGLQSVELYPPT